MVPHLYAFHFNKNKSEKDEILPNTLRTAASQNNGEKSKWYPIPSQGKPGGVEDAVICDHSFFAIMGVAQHRYKNLMNAMKSDTVIVHGLTGKPSNRSMDDETAESLHSFFKEWKDMSTPPATRFVRTETGTENIRDADVDLLELPAAWSKRQLYGAWLKKIGYQHIPKDHKGNFEIREDPNFSGDRDIKYISWATFRAFWTAHYKDLVKCRPREDMCTHCHTFANELKYRPSPSNPVTEQGEGPDYEQGEGSDSDSDTDFISVGVANSNGSAADEGLAAAEHRSLEDEETTKHREELGTKWRAIFPKNYHGDDLFREPTEAELNEHKKKKKKKRKNGSDHDDEKKGKRRSKSENVPKLASPSPPEV